MPPRCRSHAAAMQVHDVMSAIFINAEQLVTGAQDGRLLVWDVANTTTCIQVRRHSRGARKTKHQP